MVDNTILTEKREIPITLFLETLPQHFQTENGYYNGFNHIPCAPISNLTSQHELDWRNRIIYDAISTSNSGIKIISTARPLYSEYDSHIGLGKTFDQKMTFMIVLMCASIVAFMILYLRRFSILFLISDPSVPLPRL